MMLSVSKLFILWINCCATLLFVNLIKVESLRCEAQQSSTNGPFVANNACDDNIETYSLTRDDTNQAWSMTLDRARQIFGIFLSINCGSYDIHVQLNTSNIRTCNRIERMCNETSRTDIVTCNSSEDMLGNKIIIKKLDYGVLQINEVKSIDFSTLQKVAVKTQSVGLNGKDAFDGNLDSYIVTKEKFKAKWYMVMEKTYGIKWILISLRGGNYELHITVENQTLSDELTLCRVFNLRNPSKTYQYIVECESQMTGNSIIIKRTDDGPIRLFEVHPIVCPAYHYGINCAKCRKACVSCHPVSGVCNHCFESYFGDLCQYQCPTTCLKTCDKVTGSCDSCIDGHHGKYCELQMITDYKKTEAYFEQTKSSTVVIEELKEERDDKEDSSQFPILLVVLSALGVLLFLVIIFLFVSNWKKEKINIESESGLVVNLQRSESRNESDLEEILQNENDYVEEEVVVVEYSNLTSQRVSLDQFIRELPDKKSSGILEKEFDDLPSGLLESYSDALKISNRKGNRYKGIYPYDHNRVKLVRDTIEANEDNDFVNASYIHGFNREQAYIAAQGPFNPKTLEDFWTVIWQNDSTRIVMLTSLYEGDKMKCLKYWPDTELTIGSYTIKLDKVDVFNQYVLRYLVVQYQEEEKRVTQFHFTTWPDNSVPEDLTSLICFRNLLKNGLTSSDGPIVVHCSAGIGRTGTFIALDYLLEEGAAEQMIDVKGYVASLRHQRGKSIQTCVCFFCALYFKEFSLLSDYVFTLKYGEKEMFLHTYEGCSKIIETLCIFCFLMNVFW